MATPYVSVPTSARRLERWVAILADGRQVAVTAYESSPRRSSPARWIVVATYDEFGRRQDRIAEQFTGRRLAGFSVDLAATLDEITAAGGRFTDQVQSEEG